MPTLNEAATIGAQLAALDDLREGRVSFEDLVLNRRLSREPGTYEKASLEAIASQQLYSRGIPLRPGERIQVVYLNSRSKVPSERVRAYTLLDGTCSYDVAKYSELLYKATESLLIHFGWNAQRLREYAEASTLFPAAAK
jgi:DNA polymerase elongation subunit (family B)